MSTAAIQELIERLGALLRSKARLAGAAGLQPVQMQALAYLAECNRFSDTPQAVAEYLGLTKGTVSQSLKALTEHGLIARHADAQDGRVVHLRLLAKGQKLLAAYRPNPALHTALKGLSADERRALEGLLKQTLRGALAANGFQAFGLCRDCRHHRRNRHGRHCALLHVELNATDAGKRCRDFTPAAA